MPRIGFTGDGSVWTWGWGKFFLDYSFFFCFSGKTLKVFKTDRQEYSFYFFFRSVLIPVPPEKNL